MAVNFTRNCAAWSTSTGNTVTPADVQISNQRRKFVIYFFTSGITNVFCLMNPFNFKYVLEVSAKMINLIFYIHVYGLMLINGHLLKI